MSSNTGSKRDKTNPDDLSKIIGKFLNVMINYYKKYWLL
jgi:hypothetical protein